MSELPDDRDHEGLWIEGPRRANVHFTKDSAAEQDARAEKLERVRRRIDGAAKARKQIKRIGRLLRGEFARAAPPPTEPTDDAPWHPGFVPPGPAPYTAAQRDAARAVWNEARQSGAVSPPDACECCGRTVALHGHHTDYAEPLKVMWLCAKCHRLAHGYARPAHLMDATD